MQITERFEQLIRVGIGRQDRLDETPSANEWEQLHELCRMQGLLGIGYQGACQVRNFADVAKNMSRSFFLLWYLEIEDIKKQNDLFNRKCVLLEKKFADDGVPTGILKGQAIATLYHTENRDLRLLRECGDIDLWMEGGRNWSLNYLRERFGDFRFDYKHGHPRILKNIEVEVHWIPEVLTNLIKNRHLQLLWLTEHDDLHSQQVVLPEQRGTIHTLSAPLNCFYVLLHCYRHFMLGGLSMKQVLDIYFVLLHLDTIHNERVMALIHQFGMDKFVGAMMWVQHEVFQLDIKHLLIEPNEQEGRFVLNELYRYGRSRIESDNKHRMPNGGSYVKNCVAHLCHICRHYPMEAFWGFIWIIFHFLWKIGYKLKNR